MFDDSICKLILITTVTSCRPTGCSLSFSRKMVERLPFSTPSLLDTLLARMCSKRSQKRWKKTRWDQCLSVQQSRLPIGKSSHMIFWKIGLVELERPVMFQSFLLKLLLLDNMLLLLSSQKAAVDFSIIVAGQGSLCWILKHTKSASNEGIAYCGKLCPAGFEDFCNDRVHSCGAACTVATTFVLYAVGQSKG